MTVLLLYDHVLFDYPLLQISLLEVFKIDALVSNIRNNYCPTLLYSESCFPMFLCFVVILIPHASEVEHAHFFTSHVVPLGGI